MAKRSEGGFVLFCFAWFLITLYILLGMFSVKLYIYEDKIGKLV